MAHHLGLITEKAVQDFISIAGTAGATAAKIGLHRQGDLLVAGATAASKWTDWRILHREQGPFVNEMLGDPYRWQQGGVLSVMVQESPAAAHQATPLRILDYTVNGQ